VQAQTDKCRHRQTSAGTDNYRHRKRRIYTERQVMAQIDKLRRRKTSTGTEDKYRYTQTSKGTDRQV
jgi:hypothetical protein